MCLPNKTTYSINSNLPNSKAYTGLSTSKTYYLRVTVTDEAGNTTVSSAAGRYCWEKYTVTVTTTYTGNWYWDDEISIVKGYTTSYLEANTNVKVYYLAVPTNINAMKVCEISSFHGQDPGYIFTNVSVETTSRSLCAVMIKSNSTKVNGNWYYCGSLSGYWADCKVTCILGDCRSNMHTIQCFKPL